MKNILVIDDDENITLLFKKYLTKIGHNVITANNGGEGLKEFNNGHTFDVVITDIDMPGLNGNDVAGLIRKSKKGSTPIIAITGSDMYEVQMDLFDKIYQKPVKLKDLSGLISNYNTGANYAFGR